MVTRFLKPRADGLPARANAMKKQHHGSSLDDFLREEGLFEETQALAIKEVVVWLPADEMHGPSGDPAPVARRRAVKP